MERSGERDDDSLTAPVPHLTSCGGAVAQSRVLIERSSQVISDEKTALQGSMRRRCFLSIHCRRAKFQSGWSEGDVHMMLTMVKADSKPKPAACMSQSRTCCTYALHLHSARASYIGRHPRTLVPGSVSWRGEGDSAGRSKEDTWSGLTHSAACMVVIGA